MPPGVLGGGTHTNRKLMTDAATAATDSLKAKGHAIDPKGVPFDMYVVTKPVGAPGSRKWTELWIFLLENKEWPFTIHFQEDGSGAASFVIEGDMQAK